MLLSINRKYVFMLFLIFGINWLLPSFLLIESACSTEGVCDSGQSAVVTIKASKVPMGKVVEMVSEQTGYRIEISEKLLSIAVSGNFYNIEMENLFRRFLKDQNVFIVRDDGQKLIKIHTSKQTEKIFVVGGKTSDGDQHGSYQSMLDSRDGLAEKIEIGEVELELEPGVSFQAMLDSRDNLAEKIKNGEIELELEPGVSFKKMVESRDNLSVKISTGQETIVMDTGESYQSVLESRDRLESSIKNGEIELELEPGVSFQKMIDSRDRLADRIRDGEVTMATDLSK